MSHDANTESDIRRMTLNLGERPPLNLQLTLDSGAGKAEPAGKVFTSDRSEFPVLQNEEFCAKAVTVRVEICRIKFKEDEGVSGLFGRRAENYIKSC